MVTECTRLLPVLRATSRCLALCWVLMQTESTLVGQICHAPGMLLSPAIDFSFLKVGLTGSTCQSSTIKPKQVVRVQAKRDLKLIRCTTQSYLSMSALELPLQGLGGARAAQEPLEDAPHNRYSNPWHGARMARCLGFGCR